MVAGTARMVVDMVPWSFGPGMGVAGIVAHGVAEGCLRLIVGRGWWPCALCVVLVMARHTGFVSGVMAAGWLLACWVVYVQVYLCTVVEMMTPCHVRLKQARHPIPSPENRY